MAQYFFGITKEEKENILNQHKTIYDGYVTEYAQGDNKQPLYIQDFANDKEGITVSNKGDVKPYTNTNINESDLPLDMIGDGENDLVNGTVDLEDEMEYISLGSEDICEECGEMEEGFDSPREKRYFKDYSEKEYRKFPKNPIATGISDPEGTEILPKKDENEFDEFDFFDEIDEDLLPEFKEKLNESLDMFKRFKKYN